MLADELTLDIPARAALAEELARRVGREAAAFRESFGQLGLKVENKGLQDFVTVADRNAEETIRTAISARFPEDAFTGEEGGADGREGGVWVVDPIDGTTNYIRGFRHWGVSIAYVVRGAIEIGVIYDAALDRVLSATRGGGAFKDGKPIRASAVTDAHKAIAILGHSRRTPFEDYLAVARRLYEMGIDYRRMGAAAIGLTRVADGVADLYYERHLNGWDMLAGALIAHEAGAIVRMPPLDTAIREGGPILVCAAGLEHDFAFLSDQPGIGWQPL